MDTIKGIARRTTQSIREKVSHADLSSHDEKVDEATHKINRLHKSSDAICKKIIRIAELMEEFGNLVKDLGDEYRQVPDLQPVSSQLADDIIVAGNMIIATVQEQQKNLKDHGFEVLRNFYRSSNKLADVERERRKSQLEHDFFRKKVLDLRRNPPRDPSRIPRNEQILENWRVELWKATEKKKVVCSQLYSDGQRAIDLSVLTLLKASSEFLSSSDAGLKRTLVNARLPQYPVAPLLLPVPLPPNPIPPYQPPLQPGGYGSSPPWYQQQQQQWGHPQPPFIPQNSVGQSLPQQQQQSIPVVWDGSQNGQEWPSSAHGAPTSEAPEVQPNSTTWPSGPNYGDHRNGSH